MRYVLLVYRDPPWEKSPALDAIETSGELVDHARLAHPDLGTVVHSDAPDAGAPLAGYVVVECETMDRARGIARTLTHPSAAVEIRPLMRAAGLEM